MPTVAIIAEYNPFHNGHKFQVDKIRLEFGDNTEIIAIMSGNYTQRGELAIADKAVRARAAVECGVNLVLEIPFPFSAASAEFYAKSGVRIANAINVVDYLSFGSELGNADELSKIAENMLSARYQDSLTELINQNPQAGYAKLCEMAYKQAFSPLDNADFLHPNNILAIEYIKAIKTENSGIVPHSVERVGAGYSEENIISGNIQSATAIRNLTKHTSVSACDYMPKYSFNTYLSAKNDKVFPSDCEKISSAVIASFLLNSTNESKDIHDTFGGLYKRLVNNAKKATSISELVKLTETKHYTTARIRRSIWFSYFGVTSSDVRTLPLFSQVLAMDDVGRKILKRIKKSSDFPILTKPSSFDKLSADAAAQKRKSDVADAVYGLTLPEARPAASVLKFTPFVK